MAAKRLPSNDGEQNFGFLSSVDSADATDTGDTELRAEQFEPPVAPGAASASGECQPADTTHAPDITETSAPSTDHVSRKLFVGVAAYAIALTLLFLGLLLTGRMSLFGNHALESLPDLRPLAPNEFRKVPDGAELPDGHVLQLGESRRFGDVVVTPVRLTREPLRFQGFLSGAIEEKLTTKPLLKLWLTFESVADDYAFPPFDVGLMSNRTPPDSKDAAALANSFLTVGISSGDSASPRRLNYLHTMDNNFVIVGQESAKVLRPGESLSTFVVGSDEEGDINDEVNAQFVWRVQFRKGVNVSSGNGVSTLIDVEFSGADIAATDNDPAAG